MTLLEAKRKVWIYRLLGVALVVLAVLAMMLVALKYLHFMLPNNIFFQIPGRKLHDSINQILATSVVLSFIWRLIPTGDNPLFIYGLMSSCLFWEFIGTVIVRNGNSLNGRIRRTKQAIEEERWRRSLGEIPVDVAVLSIQVESEEQWYKRPSGLLLIGLIIQVIGGLVVVLWEHRLFSH